MEHAALVKRLVMTEREAGVLAEIRCKCMEQGDGGIFGVLLKVGMQRSDAEVKEFARMPAYNQWADIAKRAFQIGYAEGILYSGRMAAEVAKQIENEG